MDLFLAPSLLIPLNPENPAASGDLEKGISLEFDLSSLCLSRKGTFSTLTKIGQGYLRALFFQNRIQLCLQFRHFLRQTTRKIIGFSNVVVKIIEL